MPRYAEIPAFDPAALPGSTAATFYGRRPAQILGAAMILAMAVVTLLRWIGGTPATLEKVIQQPIPVEALTSAPRVDLTAPDPGDSPP